MQVWGFSVLQRHERKKEPNSTFSVGFRSYVRHFRGAILGLLRPSLPWCFPIRGPAAAAAKAFIFIAAARGKSSQNHHFLWVSEVTLGIFGVQFWGFSVLHCHGVFPSGDQQQQQPKPLQQQEEKIAKIHSSSKKKKQPKSSFFFLWVSEVTLGIFGVQFWGFSILHCHDVFPSGDQQQQQQKRLQQQEEKPAKIHSSSKKKKQPKSSFSMGFRSYVRHFRGAILELLRPSLPWCFPIRGPAAAAAKAFIFIAAARKKNSQNHHFLWVAEVTLGIFGVQFWGFSVLHCHGVFPSGDQQQQQQKPSYS